MSATPPMKRKKPATKPVVTYPRDAVLDVRQLAAGLGVSSEIARKQNYPSFMVGGRERWLWGDVLESIAARRIGNGRKLRVAS